MPCGPEHLGAAIWELLGILEQPHAGGHGADSVSITAHPGLLQLLSLFLAACAPAWLSHSAIRPQPWALPAVRGAQDGWMDG